MFIDNKYTKWYYEIISRAKTRTLAPGYSEDHHIIPTCLGGTNKLENLVTLTPREHFVCHLLLTKMTVGQHKYKMGFALSMISSIKNIGGGRYVCTSKLYEYSHKQFRESLDAYWTPENRQRHAEKISLVTKGRKIAEKARESYRNKIWTDNAVANRLQNCLDNAALRKGIKNPDHGKRIFRNYVDKNKQVIKQIWELFDQGMNRRQISLALGISWDRVNLAINNRLDIGILL